MIVSIINICHDIGIDVKSIQKKEFLETLKNVNFVTTINKT